MTNEDIKKIRYFFDITQDELATILGVTKTTITRYENDKAKPTGDAEKKLLYMYKSLLDPDEASILKEFLKSRPGGIAMTSGLLSFSNALLPATSALAIGGLAAILCGTAAKGFIELLTKFYNKD